MNYRQQAIEAYAEYQAKQEERYQRDKEHDRDMSKHHLNIYMQKVFGEDVKYDVIWEEDRAYGVVIDFPRARFFSRGHTLVMEPTLNIPDGPEYEEWYENNLNRDYPRGTNVSNFKDIGALLNKWETATWDIKPWVPKEEKEIKPKRFDELTMQEANQATRPFKVLGIDPGTIDHFTYLIVEYTDL